MFLKRLQIVPPNPHPRRQQKSPARGADKLEKNVGLMIFHDFYENSEKSSFNNSKSDTTHKKAKKQSRIRRPSSVRRRPSSVVRRPSSVVRCPSSVVVRRRPSSSVVRCRCPSSCTSSLDQVVEHR